MHSIICLFLIYMLLLELSIYIELKRSNSIIKIVLFLDAERCSSSEMRSLYSLVI
jgi:hypothetical protein